MPAGLGHPLCATEAPSTCGTTGVCDGFGTCAQYPPNSPCGPSSCSGVTAMNTARACDGLGTCEASELRACGTYRCADIACNSKCTTNADCADGIACVAGLCGPKVDGQACTADADCMNLHCVRDVATGAGICCNTACAGACRSCALPGAAGRCSPVANGAADPRNMCVDMGAATCGTDSRCDGAMACRRYATGTVCSAGDLCHRRLHGTIDLQCLRPVSQAARDPLLPLPLQRDQVLWFLHDGRPVCVAPGLRHERDDQQLRSEATGRGVFGRQRVHEQLLRAGRVLQQRVQHGLPRLQLARDDGHLQQREQRCRSAGHVRRTGAGDLRHDGPVRGRAVRGAGLGHPVHRPQLSDGIDATAPVDLQRDGNVRDARDRELRPRTLRHDDADLQQHLHDERAVHGARDLRERIVRSDRGRGDRARIPTNVRRD